MKSTEGRNSFEGVREGNTGVMRVQKGTGGGEGMPEGEGGMREVLGKEQQQQEGEQHNFGHL